MLARCAIGVVCQPCQPWLAHWHACPYCMLDIAGPCEQALLPLAWHHALAATGIRKPPSRREPVQDTCHTSPAAVLCYDVQPGDIRASCRVNLLCAMLRCSSGLALVRQIIVNGTTWQTAFHKAHNNGPTTGVISPLYQHTQQTTHQVMLSRQP